MAKQELVFSNESGILLVENFWDCECGNTYRKEDTPKCEQCGKTHDECSNSRASELLEFYSFLLTDDEIAAIEAEINKGKNPEEPPEVKEALDYPSVDLDSLIPLEIKFDPVFMTTGAKKLFDQLQAKAVADEIGNALLTSKEVTENMNWYFWCESQNGQCHLRGEDADAEYDTYFTYFNGNGILLTPFEERKVCSKHTNLPNGETGYVLSLE
jgi:hypothetical protein